MSNVYEGAPDGRQSADVTMPTSRFRPRYRALTEAEKALHDEIKDAATALEERFIQIANLRAWQGLEPQGRYAAMAVTSLEESVMWAIKGLTSA